MARARCPHVAAMAGARRPRPAVSSVWKAQAWGCNAEGRLPVPAGGGPELRSGMGRLLRETHTIQRREP
jgi:hypothetical protein